MNTTALGRAANADQDPTVQQPRAGMANRPAGTHRRRALARLAGLVHHHWTRPGLPPECGTRRLRTGGVLGALAILMAGAAAPRTGWARSAGPAADAAPHAAAVLAAAGRSGGPDAFGYTFDDSEGHPAHGVRFQDISGTGTVLAQGGTTVASLDGGNLDDGYYEVTVPFPFRYYGVQRNGDSLFVSTNGFATFDSAGATSLGGTIPDNGPPNDGVYPFWDDLVLDATAFGIDCGTDIDCGLYVQTVGSAPNRRFIVQWNEVPFFGEDPDDGWVTFQAQLEESTGDVRFEYRPPQGCAATDCERASGASASIGIESADPANGAGTPFTGLVYSQDEPALQTKTNAFLDNIVFHSPRLAVTKDCYALETDLHNPLSPTNLDAVTAGQQWVCRIEVVSDSPGDIPNVQLRDRFGPGLTLIGVARTNIPNFTISPAAPLVGPATVDIDLGTVPGRSRSFFELGFLVDPLHVANTPNGEGEVCNQVTIRNPAVADANDQVDDCDLVIDRADLTLDKILPSANVAAGVPFVYTVLVDNLGPSAARGVRIRDDVLSSGIFSVAGGSAAITSDRSMADLNGGGAGLCTVAAAQIECALDNALEPTGETPPGGAQTGRWTVRIPLVATEAQSIVNRACAVTQGLVRPPAGPAGDWVNGTVDHAAANNCDSESATVLAVADLAITKSDNVGPFTLAGTDYNYTLTVTNNGPSTATGVVALDTLPLGVHLRDPNGILPPPPISVAGGGGSCTTVQGTAQNITVQCNLGDMPAADVRTITLRVTTDPALPPQVLINRAEVQSRGSEPAAQSLLARLFGTSDASESPDAAQQLGQPAFDPDPSNNIAREDTNLGELAVLVVDKDGSPDPVTAGGVANYRIEIENTGPSVARNVRFDDVFADIAGQNAGAFLTLLDADVFGGAGSAACHQEDFGFGTSVRCTLGDLAVNQVVRIDLKVAVGSNTPPGANVLANTVAMAADSSIVVDPGSDLTAQLDVTGTSQLSITKVASDPSPLAGGAFSYTVTVTNNGPSTAYSVGLVDALPAGVSFVSVNDARCTESPVDVVTCAFGQMAAQQSIAIVITVELDGDFACGASIVNAAVATWLAAPGDTNGLQAAGVSTTRSTCESDIVVTKLAKPDDVQVIGQPVEYTVIVDNRGPSAATGVAVKDLLQSDGEFDILSVDSDRPATCNSLPLAGGGPFSVPPAAGAVAGVDRRYQLDCTLDDPLGVLAADGPPNTGRWILTVRAQADSAQSLNNVATGVADVPDPDTSNNQDETATRIANDADLRMIKIASPSGPVLAGDQISYLLVVDNLGPSAASGVSIVDAITSDGLFDLVGVNPNVDGNRPTATCAPLGPLVGIPGVNINCSLNAGVLEPFGVAGTGRWRVEVILRANNAQTVNNIATTSHGANDPDLSNNVDELSREIDDLADLALLKTDVADPVTAGGPISYELTVSNIGPSVATNVVVVDTAPPGVTVTSATVPGGSCAINGSTITCNLGSIAPAAQDVITIVGTVNDDVPAGTILINSAIAYSDSYDPNTSNNVDSEPTTVIGSADLGIVKSDAVDPATAGGPLTYNLTVTNAGPSAAVNVQVVDSLPAGTHFASASAQGGTCVHQAGPNAVACDLGDMGVGETRDIIVNVVIDASVPDGAVLVNNAVVDSQTLDPNDANDSDSEPTTIRASADLRLEKSADPATLLAGDTVHYTIQVTNFGPSDALAVSVVDTLPAGFTFLHDTDSCVEAPAGTLTCTLGTLVAGGSTSFDVYAQVDVDTPGGVYANNAVASSPTSDPNPADNADSVDVSVLTSADLRITKTAAPSGPVNAGDIIVYTIYVDNLGPSSAAGVVMNDAITSDGLFDVLSVVSSRPAVCAPLFANSVSTVDIDCTLTGTLEPVGVGGDGRWTITVEVVAANALTVNNVATVDADTPDSDPTNNIDEASRDITSLSDLEVQKTSQAIPDPLVAGGQIKYTVVVTNTGPSAATGVKIADRLPAGVTVNDYMATDAAGNAIGCSTGMAGSAADPLRCGFGKLAVGEFATVMFTATVDSDLADGTVLENDVMAMSDNPDPDNSNNFDSTLDVVTTSADVSIVKTDAPDPVTAGEELSYVLVVSNAGPSTARDVTVSDVLPPGTTFLDANVAGGTCIYAAGPNSIACDLGDLAVGDARVITVNVVVDADVPNGTVLTNIATVTSSTDDPDIGDNASSAVTTVAATADLSIDKTAAGTGIPGSEILYTITVTNHGPSEAQAVQVLEAFPAGVTYVWDDDNCAPGGSPCSLGNIAAGDSVTFHVAVSVNENAIGVLENAVRVISTTPDPDLANNTDIADVTAVPTADMQIMKYGVPEVATTGEAITFTLLVQNLGPGLARNVVISDTFIADGAYRIVDINGATCVPGLGAFTGNSVHTCSVGDMAAFTQHLVEFVVTTTDSTVITNVAAVRSDAWDPNLGNNKDDETIHDIRQAADVRVEKTSRGIPGPGIVAGEEIEYTITVTNDGPSTATGVQILDRLPNGIVVTGFDTTGPDGVSSFGCTTGMPGSWFDQFTCNVGTLAPGESATVVFTADVNANLPDGTVLENDVLVWSDNFDRDPTDNRDTTLDVVGTLADLSVQKFGNPGPLRAGELTSYDIVYNNAGPSAARDVILTDVLPPNLDPVSVFVVDGLNAFDSATCHIRTGDPVLVGSIVCELGNVPAGQGGRIVVTARVRADAPVGPVVNNVFIDSDTADPDTTNNTDDFTGQVAQAADLAITKRILGVPVAGQPIVYEMTVTNLGPSVATSVQVVDNHSANLSYSWDTDSCSPSGVNQITCNLGTIAVGGSRTYQVTYNVAANSAFADATNSVTVSAAQSDPNPANNNATTRVPIRGISDLRITKFGKPDSDVRQSGLLTYTILVENLGPSDASNVVVRDTIASDGNYEIVSITGATCVPGVGIYLGNVTMDCTLPNPLAAFAQASIRMVIRPIEARSINNFAAVQSRNSDPDRSNDAAIVEHDITELADLSVTKTAAPDPAVAGGSIVWTMQVTNNGPGIAENVVLMDRLPSGIVVSGFSASLPLGATGGCTTGTAGSAVDQLKCNLGTLLNGESATVTVTADVNPSLPDGHILENDVMVSSDVLDIRNQNNRATTLTPVSASANLSIAKSASPNPATAGQPLQYTLTIGNGGPSTAKSVIVVDTLPAGVTYVNAVVIGQPGATCAPVPAGSVTCQLGDMLPSQLVTIYIQTIVNPGFAGTLTNTATVRSLTADPSSANNTATTNTPVNQSADLSIHKLADRLVVTPGRNHRYTITVRNNGPSDALNVQVLDTLPAGVTFVADQDACTAAGQNVTCNLGTLLVGQTVQFDIEVSVAPNVADNLQLLNNARVTSTTPDPVAGNNTSVAEVVTNRLADLSVRKFGKPDGNVRTGEDLIYTILVDNFGPSDAGNVVVQDILKADGRFEFRSVTGATCAPAPIQSATQSLTLSCTIGNIPTGTTAQVTIVVRSIDSKSINNVATARSGDAEDPNTSNNTGYVEHDITLLADMSVTKVATGEVTNPGPANCGLLTTLTPNAVTAGRNLTYVLTVTNNGPNITENVVVRDRLPSGFAVTSIAVTGGGTCNAGTPGSALDVVTCGLDGMTIGQVKTITIVGKTDPNLSGGLILVNDANVTSALLDANNQNNYAHNLTTVSTAADLAITKTAEPPVVVAGQTIVQYTIMVTNNGPSLAQAVTVLDNLPVGITFLSASGANCRQNPANLQQITCQVGDLPAGGMATIFLVGRVNADTPPGVLNNTASVTSKTADPCAANNTSAPAPVTVIRVADVFIRKTALADPVIAGDLIRWRVTFGNNGPSTATNVRIEDLLPLGVLFQRCEPIDPNDVATCNVISGNGTTVRQTVRLQTLNMTNVAVFTDLGEIKAGVSFAFDLVGRVESGYVLDQRGDGDPGEMCAAYGAAAGGYTAFAHNRVTITSAQDSALAGNNFDDVCTRVNGLADLSIDKSLESCDVVMGNEPVTYLITVTNLGPSDAAKVVVKDLLPEQLDMSSVTVDAGGGMLVSVNPVTREVTIMAGNGNGQIGRINAGTTATIKITGTWKPSDVDFEATDTASVTTIKDSVTWPGLFAAGDAPSSEGIDALLADDPLAPGSRTPTTDPNAANNSVTFKHLVLADPVLLVNKTVSLTGLCPGVNVPVMVGPGQSITYCIELTNRTSLRIEPGAIVTDTVRTKLGDRLVFTKIIEGAIEPGEKVNLKVTDRFTGEECGNTTNNVIVTAVIRTGLGDECLRPISGRDSHPIMVPCTDGATGADTRIGLPIINGPGAAACNTWIQIQNLGCSSTKSMVVFWGDRSACPPQSAGPLKVECTGLLRPGSAWSMLAEGNQIPAGAKSAIAYALNADDLIKTPRGNDLPFADAACGFLFQAFAGDYLAWSEFDQAYRTFGTFRWVFSNENLEPLVLDFGLHQGQPLGVTINQGCPDPTDPNTTNNGGYAGIPTAGTGTYDPTFGGYTYYAPLVFANKAGLNSLIAIQNLGIECTSLEIYLKDPDNCMRPIIGDVLALAPGERISFDPNTVAGPDWLGTAWIRATQPLAVAATTEGPNHLTIYNGVPGDVYSVGFSLGSQVNYAPLTYSEYQGWDSAISVQNLSAVYAAKVKVYFLDRGGDIITTLVDWVCPRGSQTFFLPVIAAIPGNWVGSARVESQEWVTPGGPQNDPPRVQSVMMLERWSDPARTTRREAIAYNLLTEQVAFDWQLGILNGGTTSGSAVIAIPLLAKGNRGITSEIGITNLVPKPGFTDFAIFIYDQNGLIDFYCQKLNEKQVEYIDLNTQGFISRNFLGSAVISATFWEHDVFDATGQFQRNLVGLGAVIIERVGNTQGGEDAPGDESKGYEGIPVGKPFCENRPACPGVPEFNP